MATRKPARRRAYHHGSLKSALLRAALDLVAAEGTDALTLRAAARRAGVSQAAPYRHFRDKEALLAAVAEEGFRALSAAMRRVEAAGVSAVERFRQLGLAYVRFARTHAPHYRVMFGRGVGDFARHPKLHAASEETFGLLVDAIADCQREGMVREGDPRALAFTVWATTHGLVALWADGPLAHMTDVPIDDLAEIAGRDLFLGLVAPGAGPPGPSSRGQASSSG
jgi:AcrR family transcriptional regulator